MTSPKKIDQYGKQFSPAVRNANKLTLAFSKAAAARQKDQSDNFVLSTYNAMACLAMVAAGAEGDTRAEFAEALFGVPVAKLEQATADYIALNKEILAANKGNVTLTTANSVWVNADMADLKKGYKADIEKTFEATVDRRSFADPATVPAMNKWGNDNTNGLIPKFVDQLDKDAYAILASALYFKGDWTHKFDKKLTEDKAFLQDGDVRPHKTPTMHQDYKEKQGLRYHNGADYEAVALTYGANDSKNGKTPSMRVVLVRPKDGDQTARDWLATQADGFTPAWMDPVQFQKVTGSVELPHIDIKQTHQLKKPLQDLYIKQAFSDKADFSRMSKEQLILDFVKQDLVFKTNEEGSEAAFITSAGMMRSTSVHVPPPRIDIKMDRSFVVALQDIATGAVIFTGVINKPNNDMKPTPAICKGLGPKPKR